MEKDQFKSFCDNIKKMISDYPDWYNRPHSLISDYIMVRTSYGYGKALSDMLVCAFDVLRNTESDISRDEIDLYELTAYLAIRIKSKISDDYKFSAYYFVMSLITVCYDKYKIDDIDLNIIDSNDFINFDVEGVLSQETDPQKINLRRYALRLIDFSSRNSLVHFKPNKSSALSLFSANPYEIARKLQKNENIYIGSWDKIGSIKTIVKCGDCGRYEFSHYSSYLKVQNAVACKDCDAAGRKKRMKPIQEFLTLTENHSVKCPFCNNFISVEQLEGNDFICHKCHRSYSPQSYPLVDKASLAKCLAPNEILSCYGDASTLDTVGKLNSNATKLEKNFGLHVLYLACGFLHWRDSHNTEYTTPLLLCPVTLHTDRMTGEIVLKTQNQDSNFFLNQTLVHMLNSYSKNFAIRLPNFDGNIDIFFAAIKPFFYEQKASLHKTKNWYVENGLGLGLFRYQKIELYDDLTINFDTYLTSPIIKRLCGDISEDIPSQKVSNIDAMSYMVVDADSSQEEVIKASEQGKSFILQGPPGSGKSQTITNMIAVAMAEGKSILFVTEKASARSVILENLRRCKIDNTHSLTDFVLDFESIKKVGGILSKNAFANEVNKHLSPELFSFGISQQSFVNNNENKRRIDCYMSDMKKDFDSRCYMQLLEQVAEYASYPNLNSVSLIPRDDEKFSELCFLLDKYYIAVSDGKVQYDYRKDPLFHYNGENPGELIMIAKKYKDCFEKIVKIMSILSNKYHWKFDKNRDSVILCANLLKAWSLMPALNKTVLESLSDAKIDHLIDEANSRTSLIAQINSHVGKSFDTKINFSFASVEVYKFLLDESRKYKNFLARHGDSYSSFKNRVFRCLKVHSHNNYFECKRCLKILGHYYDYASLCEQYNEITANDFNLFGMIIQSENQWTTLLKDLKKARAVLHDNDMNIVNMSNCQDWLNEFDIYKHGKTVENLCEWSQTLFNELKNEENIRKEFQIYFSKLDIDDDFLYYISLADKIVRSEKKVWSWSYVLDILKEFKTSKWIAILEELIDKNIKLSLDAKNTLLKEHLSFIAKNYVSSNRLSHVENFDKNSHVNLMHEYSKTDMEILSTGAKRLYSLLDKRVKDYAIKINPLLTPFPQITPLKDQSIKDIILQNQDYLKVIKPCFMMSPLNVSQYLSIDLKFDLVIFDEASQIFTEDALATLVRGKQIIIAGDSKQLPPSDFFHTSEVYISDDAGIAEDEENKNRSLLTSADSVMNDASIQLSWHYRSCDESLIAFSNKHMNYNLISFPSAEIDDNDGIKYVNVPYNPKLCYSSGSKGAHTNIGEANKIVDIIWDEINNPQRSNFSIGVVAFSDKQAQEIEKGWQKLKSDPLKKTVIETWEKNHEDDPIIFCNLDTMQGDERDTMILSICYSEDANQKFKLSYLGRLRIESGKNRLNVAVTRARHQMIVVSTLLSSTLDIAITNSSAPEENKSGAKMLAEFLRYAESFSMTNNFVSHSSDNTFVHSICRFLDIYKIQYETEIGRSDCKINIAIKNPKNPKSFVLGIIVDDPRRADFDIPREYCRLTESVLIKKYKWKIYRIFPISWIFNNDTESMLLLSAVNDAIAKA